MTTPARDATFWTIAYRNRRANRFQRATDVATDWRSANEIAHKVGLAHPELEVWTTTTAEAERAGWTCAEDAGNILVDSGKRVRVFDTGSVASLMPEDIVARNAGEACTMMTTYAHDSTDSYTRAYCECSDCRIGQQISNGNSTIFAHGFNWGENLMVVGRTELGWIVKDRHGRHGYAY